MKNTGEKTSLERREEAVFEKKNSPSGGNRYSLVPDHPVISYRTLHLHRSLSGPFHYTEIQASVSRKTKWKDWRSEKELERDTW